MAKLSVMLRWRTRYLFDDEGIRRYARVIKTIWKPHSNKNHLEKSYYSFFLFITTLYTKNSHWFLYLEYVFRQNRIRSLFNALYRKDTNNPSLQSFSLFITLMNIYVHRHQRTLIARTIRNKTWIFLFVNFTQNGFSWSNWFSRFSTAVRTIVGGQLSYYAGQQLKLKPIWKNVAK